MSDQIASVVELNLRLMLRDLARRAVIIHPAWLERVGVGDLMNWASARGMILSNIRQPNGRSLCVAHPTLGALYGKS